MQNISKILVDADACPVKDEIVQVGTKNLCRNFVCRIACSSFKKTARNWVYVDSEQDEVDLYISTCKSYRSRDHTECGSC